jgi:putative ABC transport system substrate-binding protein
MMSRRAFLRTVSGGLLAVPLAAEAQRAGKVYRIGYLSLGGPSKFRDAFDQGLRELGYIDGQNIRVDSRYARGQMQQLAGLAAELVGLRVDLIVAQSTQAIDAARGATNTIPIVFPVTFDPVESGFVESLARPGRNLTGLTPLNPEVTAKRVELIHEAIPGLSRVAVVRNPTNSGSSIALRETERAATRLGIRLDILEVRKADELDGAFRAAARHAKAVMVFSDNLFFGEQRRVAELANKHRMPQIFDTKGFVEDGGLMSYGAELADLYRRSASYVDKILKGASPATLPVEQATKFELVINLKTAKALGLTIPPALLGRADHVIE